LLLEQVCDCDDELIAEFVAYFESAHADARAYFHEQIGIELHPDANAAGPHITYPTCLPSIARRGLFGEVMAGMLTKHYEYIGGHKWTIPVFLFRHHADAEAYLFTLARDEERTRELFGRHGSDFLALALDDDGDIERFIDGEAKWRKELQPSVVANLMYGKKKKNKKTDKLEHSGKGIWFEINREHSPPHGLRQLQRLLQEIDPTGYSTVIAKLDRVLVLKNPEPLPRTNLILLSGGDVPSREPETSLIPWEKVPGDYTAPHDLQVVELILRGGEKLIDNVYDALWAT